MARRKEKEKDKEKSGKGRDSAKKQGKPVKKGEERARPRKSPAPEKEKPARDNRVFRVITGVVFAILAIYTLVVLVSYIFTWGHDQSLLSTPDLLGDGGLVAHNKGGKIGFLWADFLVSKLFGFGAFAVPFFLASIAIYALHIRRVNLLRIFIISLFGAIIFSVLFSFVFNFLPSQELLGNGPGGSYGHFVTEWLRNMTGDFGTGCIIFVALFLWAVMLSRKVAWWFDSKVSMNSRVPALAPADEAEAEDVAEDLYETPVGDVPEVEFSGSSPAGTGSEVVLLGGDGITPDVADIPLEVEGDTPSGNPPFGDDLPPADAPAGDISPDDDLPAGDIPADDIAADGDDLPDGDIPLDVEESENDFLSNMSDAERERLFNPKLDLPDYQMPPLSFLEEYRNLWHEVSRDELERNKQRIVNALANYKIGVVGITAKMGPTVTLYKIRLAEGVKIAQVRRLEEDIAMSIGAKGVRVVTLLDSVGIEVPNDNPSVVPLKSVLNSPQFKEKKMELPLALGITVTNEPFFLDLAKMPHLLVAGATGMGKSVGLNCIIASLLYTKHPAEMKLVMVDPKKVEFSLYSKLEKHYLAALPDYEEAIITDTKNVVTTLKSLCVEMEDRYELLKKADVRQIKDYNAKFLERRLNPVKGHKFLPYIVVVIDEFADLLMVAGREIEEPIARLAQKARAIGIHLVIATQRPTTDIITGTIKANFNSRIAFRVNSSVDSKTIIDGPGANRLIGRGDMLVIHPGADIDRVQCALIDTPEIIRLNKFINDQLGFSHAFYLPEYVEEGGEESTDAPDLHKRDKLFEEAARIVVQYQQGSASLLQRKLNLGYNRAGRLIDQLEAAGIVGRSEGGGKSRSVLISDFETLDRKIESLDHQPI